MSGLASNPTLQKASAIIAREREVAADVLTAAVEWLPGYVSRFGDEPWMGETTRITLAATSEAEGDELDAVFLAYERDGVVRRYRIRATAEELQ